MAAAPGVTLDAHRARYSLAARRRGSHPTDEGMRPFPQMAAGGDIIADRLGGQNRWPLTAGLANSRASEPRGGAGGRLRTPANPPPAEADGGRGLPHCRAA